MAGEVLEACARYQDRLTQFTHDRMSEFLHGTESFKSITHQLASPTWHPEFAQDEMTLITRGLDRFTDIRLQAIGEALQHGVGIGLNDAIPEDAVFAQEPEVDRGDAADISGVLSIPIDVDEQRWWLSICGYYMKSKVDDKEVIAQARSRPVAFPVAYALRETAASNKGLKEQRYFPYRGQTHYQGRSEAAPWIQAASIPALGGSISEVAWTVGGFFR